MTLAIDTHDLALGIDHRQAVIMMRSVPFKKTGRDGNPILLGQPLHGEHRSAFVHGLRQREQGLIFGPAEIGAGKQFRREDDLGSLLRRLGDKASDGKKIFLFIAAERQLQGRYAYIGHSGPDSGLVALLKQQSHPVGFANGLISGFVFFALAQDRGQCPHAAWIVGRILGIGVDLGFANQFETI